MRKPFNPFSDLVLYIQRLNIRWVIALIPNDIDINAIRLTICFNTFVPNIWCIFCSKYREFAQKDENVIQTIESIEMKNINEMKSKPSFTSESNSTTDITTTIMFTCFSYFHRIFLSDNNLIRFGSIWGYIRKPSLYPSLISIYLSSML